MQLLSFVKKNGPFLFLLTVLMPWIAVHMTTALNANHAWLLIAAERLLDGGRELTNFYEPNPPLSILLYVPSVLLSRLIGIPLYYTPYLIGFFALLLSAWAIFLLLSKWPDLGRDRSTVFVCAYILAGTLLAAHTYFAERDEFTVWGLVPLLIVQVAITLAVPLPRKLSWFVLILSTAAILIKIQYGFLPALLILHRILRRRKIFSVMKDADFIALAVGVCLYAAMIIIFFPDYLRVIFPDFLKLYMTAPSASVARIALLGSGAAIFMTLLAGGLRLSSSTKDITQLCCIAANLCVGLFALQGRDLYYHLIPALVFFYCALGMMLYGIAERFYKFPSRCVWMIIIALTALAYSISPVYTGMLTHEEYRQLKLPKLAAETGAEGSFFVFNGSMEMISQASLYSGAVHASRFPSLWWLTRLETLKKSTRDEKFAQYAGYVAEDLQRYKPRIMAIAINVPTFGKPNFNLVGYLSADPAFRKEMLHYSKTGQMTDNWRDYFRGTILDYDHPIIYDIYRRIQP